MNVALSELLLDWMDQHVEVYLREPLIGNPAEDFVIIGTLVGLCESGYMLTQDTETYYRRVFIPKERVAYVTMHLTDEEEETSMKLEEARRLTAEDRAKHHFTCAYVGNPLSACDCKEKK